jgi:hypothetical protein
MSGSPMAAGLGLSERICTALGFAPGQQLGWRQAVSFKVVEFRGISVNDLVAGCGVHITEHGGDELLRIRP